MCKHCSEALLSSYHSIKNQHGGLTVAALMQSAQASQSIHHTNLGPACVLMFIYCVYVFVCRSLTGSSRSLFNKD